MAWKMSSCNINRGPPPALSIATLGFPKLEPDSYTTSSTDFNGNKNDGCFFSATKAATGSYGQQFFRNFIGIWIRPFSLQKYSLVQSFHHKIHTWPAGRIATEKISHLTILMGIATMRSSATLMQLVESFTVWIDLGTRKLVKKNVRLPILVYHNRGIIVIEPGTLKRI